MSREVLVAQTFVELADSLVEDFDVVELLTLLADRCVATLNVSSAGLMLAAPGEELTVFAASTEEMRSLEVFEIQSRGGPCLDCYNTGNAVINRSLAESHDVWPLFTPRAIESGFETVSALPMQLRGNVIGVLNLFGAGETTLNENDIATGQALADVATIAILQHRAGAEAQKMNDQLTFALNSRVVIEQAKGVVAEQRNISIDEAFTLLRLHSRNNNLRLTDVAANVVERVLAASSLQSY